MPKSLPTESESSPAAAQTLGFLLREAYAALQDRVYAHVAEAGHDGIRATHSPVLRHLPLEGGRVADLARAAGMAKQSMAYVVEDLVALGYLRVEPDPDDGRARRVVYTSQGRKLLQVMLSASADVETALAQRLSAERLADLRRSLVELANSD